jgi:L-fucose isomerase-like protein
MYKAELILGIAPIKRAFLSMDEAKRQKDCFMAVARTVNAACVRIVDLDGVCENGIAYKPADTAAAVELFRRENIDALFLPFCDFGEEQVAAGIAAALKVPTLVWGARDERPNTDESRGRDTQCGMFAATKVLRRYGVTYSYILNVPAESAEFRAGFDRFLRAAFVVKSVKGLRVAKIGSRPEPFMSVATSESGLMARFGMTVVPLSPADLSADALRLARENGTELREYLKSLRERVDCRDVTDEHLARIAALKIAIREAMARTFCTVAATECWSAFYSLLGVPPCFAMGELAAENLPIACETDVCGAVTLAILRACKLAEEACFLADLTIRNPMDDNSELLWHCGPFSGSLKDDACPARIVEDMGHFRLRDGDLTVCRFDEAEGNFYLFAGEGRATFGPETNGTYVYLKVDNWSRWEEKLMFGPYIHHVGCVYGHYLLVLREAARYLGLIFDEPDGSGPKSL